LERNGEAIYGTQPWQVFGEGPTEIIAGHFNDTKRESFTSTDLRFTQKGETLYAMALKWPENGQILIKSLTPDRLQIQNVELLGNSGQPTWSLSARGLGLDLTSCQPSPFPLAFRIS
jgi:alpha-L-fucosidase